jgi:hypothetical protein
MSSSATPVLVHSALYLIAHSMTLDAHGVSSILC